MPNGATQSVVYGPLKYLQIRENMLAKTFPFILPFLTIILTLLSEVPRELLPLHLYLHQKIFLTDSIVLFSSYSVKLSLVPIFSMMRLLSTKPFLSSL